MSAPDSACTSRQDAANQNAYGDPAVVGCYAGSGARLFPSEKAILSRMANGVRGRRILDLGVGGGRTTPHLLELTADYLGVDDSPELIAACQAKFPGVRFEQGDARALEILGEGTFDPVFFSFNGIDHVSHPERQQILAQVMHVLKPGGLFWFSSHNVRVPDGGAGPRDPRGQRSPVSTRALFRGPGRTGAPTRRAGDRGDARSRSLGRRAGGKRRGDKPLGARPLSRPKNRWLPWAATVRERRRRSTAPRDKGASGCGQRALCRRRRGTPCSRLRAGFPPAL